MVLISSVNLRQLNACESFENYRVDREIILKSALNTISFDYFRENRRHQKRPDTSGVIGTAIGINFWAIHGEQKSSG